MGFSSGASSAKRKAAKAAAAQYYQEFAKLKALPALERISTKNSREIEDALGNEASFRTRNLAKKSDRMARQINKDPALKEAVSAYNDRYKILKDQIANKSTKRYAIAENPIEPPKQQNNFFGIGASVGINGVTSVGSLGSFNEVPQSSFATQGKMYQTKDEAIADAQKQMETYNSGLSKLIGTAKPRNQPGMGAFPYAYPVKYTKADVDAMRISDPSRFINQENFDGFGVLYRDLSKAESAANDLNALSKNFNNSTGYKASESYSVLANKLKPLIKKDARDKGVLTDNQSMVSGELASATPYTETIK